MSESVFDAGVGPLIVFGVGDLLVVVGGVVQSLPDAFSVSEHHLVIAGMLETIQGVGILGCVG